MYISSVSTSPATVLGFGTWTAIEGYTLVGYKSGDSDFGTVNATGGAKTVTLTVDQIPAHTHSGVTGGNGEDETRPNTPSASDNRPNVGTYTTSSVGGGQAHNNLQPYKVKYMWERTA